MKKGIHPEFQDSVFVCACGNTIKTRSLKSEYKLEICAACHPFFTGKQKLVDSAGRVERFMKKYGDMQVSTGKKPARTSKKTATQPRRPPKAKQSPKKAKKDSD